MIDILIPLITGIVLLTKPDIFMRKDMDEGKKEEKKHLFWKLGWVLIGVSILYFFSKICIAMSGR